MQKLLERKATTKGGRNGYINQTLSGLEVRMAKPVEMGGMPNQYTNPEELFSMGYSACFASSIEYLLSMNKVKYDDISVTVSTALVPDGTEGFKFAVEIEASILGLDLKTATSYIEQAYQFCPYSKAIRGNVKVTIKP